MELNFIKDKTLGYVYAYAPKHPLANKSGKVYKHIYVMVQHIGRPLREDECVHHIDRNRENNNISNLQLMTNSEHCKLHLREDRHVFHVSMACKYCGEMYIITSRSKKKFCSQKCFKLASRKFEISKDELKSLVWLKPIVKIAEDFGVSDVAIIKRCKLLNIDRPPAGYWSKSNTKPN